METGLGLRICVHRNPFPERPLKAFAHWLLSTHQPHILTALRYTAPIAPIAPAHGRTA